MECADVDQLLAVCLILLVANLTLALLTWRRALAVKTGGKADAEAEAIAEEASTSTGTENAVLDESYLIFPSVAPMEKRKISRISSLTKHQLMEEVQGARSMLQRIHVGSYGDTVLWIR